MRSPCLRLLSVQERRLSSRCSLLESMPLFHSTDSYQKHRVLIRELYMSLWPGLRMDTRADTPKSNARSIKLRPWNDSNFIVIGNPEHSMIAFRKLISPKCPCHWDVLRDFEERCQSCHHPTVPTLQGGGVLFCLGEVDQVTQHVSFPNTPTFFRSGKFGTLHSTARTCCDDSLLRHAAAPTSRTSWPSLQTSSMVCRTGKCIILAP